MKKSTKIVFALGVAGIIAGAVLDLSGSQANGLVNAHRAAGHEPDCTLTTVADETWALCDIGRTAPSAWVQRGEAWATANGVAQGVVRRLEQSGPGVYQDLPRLYVDREKPVYMPSEIRAQLN